MNENSEKVLALPEPRSDPEEDKTRKRQKQQKAEIIELLKKTPIVQVACERSGVGRATFYRWKKDDPEFAEAVDEAIQTGSALVNDMAESQLMSGVRDGNFSAIAFWLKHNHPRYGNKIEVLGKIAVENLPLTPEQEESIKKALSLAGIIKGEQSDEQPKSN